MQGGAAGPERLNPRPLIDYLARLAAERKDLVDEVFVRRAVSAAFFALFNYWAAKNYAGGRRGSGPRQDSFTYQAFIEELLRNCLDRETYTLYVYRVGADHYVLNPTKVKLYNDPWKGAEEDVEINYDALSKSISSAYAILEFLEKRYRRAASSYGTCSPGEG